MVPAADAHTSPNAVPQGSLSFDVCVIGAGAAGLVLAEILSRDPTVRVALIEAGPDHFRDRVEPFVVRSVLKEHLGVNEGRVTAFGGATNTWGGGLIRASPADFEAIDNRPDTAWPISFESLVPHYDAIETLFGFEARDEGPKGGTKIVMEREDIRVRRRDIPVLPFRNKNFAKRFGPTLRTRPNVTILCNAKIERFAITVPPTAAFERSVSSPSSTGQHGVSYLDISIKGGPTQQLHAKNYVIAAGVVNTSLLVDRLFRESGTVQPSTTPGRYFHDHLSFPIARLWPRSQGRFSRAFGYRFERGLMLGEHFDIETKGPRRPGAFMHLSFDMSDSSILRPVRSVLNAIQRRTLKLEGGVNLRELFALTIGLPRLGLMRYLRGRLFLDPGTKVLATVDLEQVPRHEWLIERDPNTAATAVTWDVSTDDIALATRYLPIAHQILDQLKREADFRLEPLIPDPATHPAEFAEHIRKHSEDTFHCAGGVRMSASPDSLVDPDLRLRAFPNVHILSTAVFPRVGTSNPTHTILALGNRLAQHLLHTRQATR